MANEQFTTMFGLLLIITVSISFVVELFIVISVSRRYSQKKSTALKYLLLTAISSLTVAILTIILLNMAVMNLTSTIGIDTYHLLSGLVYRLINMVGMIILGMICIFIFYLFLEEFPIGAACLFFMSLGIFMGLMVIMPINFTQVGVTETPNIYVYPTILIMFASWFFQIGVIVSWLSVSYRKRKDVKDPLKSKGLYYINLGIILSFAASVGPLVARILITDISLVEVVQANIYWIISIFSGIYYYIGFIMPDWIKKRVKGAEWVEVQGKKI